MIIMKIKTAWLQCSKTFFQGYQLVSWLFTKSFMFLNKIYDCTSKIQGSTSFRISRVKIKAFSFNYQYINRTVIRNKKRIGLEQSLRIALFEIRIFGSRTTTGTTARVSITRGQAVSHALIVRFAIALRSRVIEMIVFKFSVVLLDFIVNVLHFLLVHLVDTMIHIQVWISKISIFVFQWVVIVLQTICTCWKILFTIKFCSYKLTGRIQWWCKPLHILWFFKSKILWIIIIKKIPLQLSSSSSVQQPKPNLVFSLFMFFLAKIFLTCKLFRRVSVPSSLREFPWYEYTGLSNWLRSEKFYLFICCYFFSVLDDLVKNFYEKCIFSFVDEERCI